MSNVYFLTLFACCRENSNLQEMKKIVENKQDETTQPQTKQENQAQAPESTEARGVGARVNEAKVSNYTFLFGCNPADGVAANTKFVQLFINHIKNRFEPDTGYVVIPECLGMMDVTSESVNFESTSGHLGRSLRLMRQDNRVGPKQLIVITEDDKGTKEAAKVKTKLLVEFFKSSLDFLDDEILYLSEKEAQQIENMLNQSRIFKRFNSSSDQKITEFARKIFLNKTSNCRELLTIFLNESLESEVQDFVI